MKQQNSPPISNRKILYQTEQFEVVSIDWAQGQTSAMHGHGFSQCSVLIEAGTFENTLNLGGKIERQIFQPGQVIQTPVGSQHAVVCMRGPGKTIHVYSPRLADHDELPRFKVSLDENTMQDFGLSAPANYSQLQKIFKTIKEHSISTSSPYFMNQLFSGLMPQMLDASRLIAETKTTMATSEASPLLSEIEKQVVAELTQLIGWPAMLSEGVCVPGGSAANFMAIHCARQKLRPDLRKVGMGEERFLIFASKEAHYSLSKACLALGIGTDQLISVDADSSGHMLPLDLEEKILSHKGTKRLPLLVCATAGTTVFGAFDPIDKLSAICKKYGIWLHVDGAWGGPALFSKQFRPLLKGIELADSMTFDAHKLFGANMTCSFFLNSHRGLLHEANDVSGADYLFHSDDSFIDRGKMSWQCGRPADALSFWAIWKNLGTEGLGSFVDKLYSIQIQTVEWVRSQPRLSLVANPEFLNICLRVTPPPGRSDLDWNLQVRNRLIEKNLAMINYSSNQDGSFLRLILANPFLEFSHVKQMLEWALLEGH